MTFMMILHLVYCISSGMSVIKQWRCCDLRSRPLRICGARWMRSFIWSPTWILVVAAVISGSTENRGNRGKVACLAQSPGDIIHKASIPEFLAIRRCCKDK